MVVEIILDWSNVHHVDVESKDRQIVNRDKCNEDDYEEEADHDENNQGRNDRLSTGLGLKENRLKVNSQSTMESSKETTKVNNAEGNKEK